MKIARGGSRSDSRVAKLRGERRLAAAIGRSGDGSPPKRSGTVGEAPNVVNNNPSQPKLPFASRQKFRVLIDLRW
jgi:hypothetical protein